MNSPNKPFPDRFCFIQGPILPQKILEEIQDYQSELHTGAYSLFLGQVRNDKINGKEVVAIEYTAYEDMVLKKFDTISRRLLNSYDINGIRILHSLETVKSGEISLLVLVTAGHRVGAMKACRKAVDLIKSELPIWGKELFRDGDHVWKENK